MCYITFTLYVYEQHVGRLKEWRQSETLLSQTLVSESVFHCLKQHDITLWFVSLNLTRP